MRKTKEVLRLRLEVGLGLRQIARSCSIGLGTVAVKTSRRKTLVTLVERVSIPR